MLRILNTKLISYFKEISGSSETIRQTPILADEDIVHFFLTRAYFTAATMIIAVPTGIKIFSWLKGSFSKTFLANFTNSLSEAVLTLRERFPRANLYPKNSISNNKCIDLVPYDYYLIGTIHYPR